MGHTVLLVMLGAALLLAIRAAAVKVERRIQSGRMRELLCTSNWLVPVFSVGSFFVLVFILLWAMRGY